VHLLCPLCAIRRGAKNLNAYLERFEVIMAENRRLRLSMVTLTVKNGEDLGERHAHLKNAVQSLLTRRKLARNGNRHVTEWAKAVAIVGSYEVTHKGKGWHPHVHMAVLHEDQFDYSKMIEEWARITGDSKMIHVDTARHPDEPARDFLEIFKYALKFSDLSPAHNLAAFLTLRGKRLLFSAGAFRGVEVPESLLDESIDELPYIELFYEFRQGSYQLRPDRMVSTMPGGGHG
jgi:hypothetical protein